MGNRCKKIVKKRQRLRAQREHAKKIREKKLIIRINGDTNEKIHLESTVEQKIVVLDQEHTELTIKCGEEEDKDIVSDTPVNEEHTELNIKSSEEEEKDFVSDTPVNEKIFVLDQEHTRLNIECGKEKEKDIVSDTPVNEELWVVRKQLCRGCHSDGAFWSLQITTEGESYAHLLQTYFNIQLCPVSSKEQVLCAICSLCAARLREARAFSAQARAAEERFTRFYTQNRVRVANTEINLIKEELPEDPDIGAIPDDDCDVDLPIIDEGQPKPVSKRTKVQKNRLDKNSKDQSVVGNDGSGVIRPKASKRKNKSAYKVSPSKKKKRLGDSLKCSSCEKQYNSSTGFHKHIKHIHMNIPRYTCKLCSKTFSTFTPFIKHKLDEHSIDDRIKCNACDSIFNTRKQLVNHTNSFHMLGVKHACPHCDYECFSVEAMNKHKFKHKSVKDYQCKFCRKSFVRKSTLDLHERIHTGDRRKVCNECGKAFVQKASLNYHMAKYHPEVRF